MAPRGGGRGKGGVQLQYMSIKSLFYKRVKYDHFMVRIVPFHDHLSIVYKDTIQSLLYAEYIPYYEEFISHSVFWQAVESIS